jgi:hypothetical protein
MERCIFNGKVPPEKRSFLGRDRNEFHGNDFSAANLIDVAFRTGIDLAQQRLPSNPEYLYLPDASRAVERIRAGLRDLEQNSELHRVVRVMLDGLEKNITNGQQQMLLRADNYYSHSALSREAVDKVFELLGGKQTGRL